MPPFPFIACNSGGAVGADTSPWMWVAVQNCPLYTDNMRLYLSGDESDVKGETEA